MLSIIIPSHNDKHLPQTIADIKRKAKGDYEIIAVEETPAGMRDKINFGARLAKGDYIMKCDAHCMFDYGFDVKLLRSLKDNQIVVPRRYKLDVEKWELIDEPPIDYEKLTVLDDRLTGVEWVSRAKHRLAVALDETMVFQGSCYMMSRDHWNRLGGLQTEGYGQFAQEAVELSLKTWLGGGSVIVNKETWYAHKHRKFGRTFRVSKEDIKKANLFSRDFWINNKWEDRIHDFSWLIERFGSV